MSVSLHVLASGSKGNASLVVDNDTGRALLIDCGICKRDFFERCHEVGYDPLGIEAIVITHEHTDHTKGLGVVLRGLAKQGSMPQIYTSTSIMQASQVIASLRDSSDLRHLKEEAELSLAGLRLHPFLTSHDAAQSFGFRIESDGRDVLGYLTDSGTVSEAAQEYLKDCRILALECNYDRRMLETGPYPYLLKKRIMSDTGHLSNDQAAEVLETLLSDTLQKVVAMHISENNNTYQLPQKVLAQVAEHNTHPLQAVSSYQYQLVSVL